MADWNETVLEAADLGVTPEKQSVLDHLPPARWNGSWTSP